MRFLLQEMIERGDRFFYRKLLKDPNPPIVCVPPLVTYCLDTTVPKRGPLSKIELIELLK